MSEPPMRIKSAFLFASVLLPLTGEAAAQPGDPGEGERLARNWCSQCHVIGDGAAGAADAGPPFATLARDPEKSAAALRTFLHHPSPPMPPLELSTRDIDHLVAYIKSLADR